MKASRNEIASIVVVVGLLSFNVSAKEPEELVRKFCYALQASTLCENLSMRLDTEAKFEKQVGGRFQGPDTPYSTECTVGLGRALEDEHNGLCNKAWKKYGCDGKDIPGLLQNNPFRNRNGILCEYSP